jgi:regulator of RNase E activity RraA
VTDFSQAGPVRAQDLPAVPYAPEDVDKLAKASASLIIDQGEGCIWLQGFDVLGRGRRDVRLCGPVLTVDARPGDNVAVRIGIDRIVPGQVLLIAGKRFMDRALIGEILARKAISRGAAGFVIEGAIRDSEKMAALPVPVYCLGSALLRATKYGYGDVGFPIAVSNEVVYPGDVLVADEDGVAVVRAGHVVRVARLIDAALDYEEARMAAADRGELDLGVSKVATS